MIREQFMTVVEVAKLHSIHRDYVTLLCSRGVFAGAEKVGNIWLIPREAAEKFKPTGKAGISESMKKYWADKKAKQQTPNHMPPLDELNSAIKEAKKTK
jgi:1,2-phenylacetyl-CoA epoxidase PaaB subunit